jgi:hypothetical protein
MLLYLYLIIDIWSKKAVDWDVKQFESAQLTADAFGNKFFMPIKDY